MVAAVSREMASSAPIVSRSAPRVSARTYRRRRAVAAGLVVAVLATARAALGLLGGESLPASGLPEPVEVSHRGPATMSYVVQPGDTLWSIATRLDPQGDPRPVVDRLAAANGGSTILVGQRIDLDLG